MTNSSKHSSFPAPRLLAVGLLCALLSGCMVGPNYHAPAVPTPSAYKEPAPAPASSVPAGTAWWNVFNDATLNDLETQAIAANPDVRLPSPTSTWPMLSGARFTPRSFPQLQLALPSHALARRSSDPTMATPVVALPHTTISSFLSVSVTRSTPGDIFAVWCSRLQSPSRLLKPTCASFDSQWLHR